MKTFNPSDGIQDLKEAMPGKKNRWEVVNGENLKLVESYPNFDKDLHDSLVSPSGMVETPRLAGEGQDSVM